MQLNHTPDQTPPSTTPNLDSYCDEAERDFYATQFDQTERDALELAFTTLESTFIELHLYSADRARTLQITLGSIFDNARDLARDEDYLEQHPTLKQD